MHEIELYCNDCGYKWVVNIDDIDEVCRECGSGNIEEDYDSDDGI